MNNNNTRNLLLLLSIMVLAGMVFNMFKEDSFSRSARELAFSEFMDKISAREISSVKITQGDAIEGTLRDGTKFSTNYVYVPDMVTKIHESGARIEVAPTDNKVSLLGIFISWFPTLLLIGVWIYFMRNMSSGAGKAMGFGKSKAKLMSDKGPKVTFKDVAGISEAKEELSEIVDFLRDPGKFQKLGGKIPKGCLLVGPPGTGKTLLAKAIAGEANVPFFSISGSDFVEMFVGVGASRVRDMFEQAKRSSPCIVFIDEIDAVGRHRGVGLGGGNDEREQTLNQLLVEMDGFDASEGVVIVAATNRPDVLDKALLRPGRFDRQIVVSNPDVVGREEILKVHLSKVKHIDILDLKVLARGTPGFSGAELANLVNEAALLAARRNKKFVDMKDLDDAKDKVLMGVERKSMALSPKEKELTAYHEAGHAIVSIYTKASDPIHKATIIPRGQALGMVMNLPSDDKFSMTREQMESRIAVFMGGRVAEEIIFGRDKVTSGASSDIKGATNIAKMMVTEWGLSDRVGAIFHGESNDSYAYGGTKSPKSEKTNELIDSEVKSLIDDGYNLAKKILTEKFDKLHLLARQLIDHETLTGQQINNLMEDRSINDNGDSKKSEKTESDLSDSSSAPKKTLKKVNTEIDDKSDDKIQKKTSKTTKVSKDTKKE